MVKDAPWEVHLMSLLEDVGLVKMLDGPAGAECIYGNGMVIPDWAINGIVAFTIALWLIQAKIV